MSKTGQTKVEIEKKVNSWLCPVNPVTQVAEYFYNMRKKNG